MPSKVSSKTASPVLILVITAMAVCSGCGGSLTANAPNTGTAPSPISPPPITPAPPAGLFTPTGDMTIARADHWATLLPDGRVLIIGGRSCAFCTSDPAENSAEFYDPSVGKFTPADVAFTARGGHKAIMLPDGKILIVGGIVLQDGRTLLTNDVNAEIYDPVTDSLAVTGAYVKPIPQSWTTGTLLLDGRVLLTGCALDCSVGVTEVFDPRSGEFSSTGSMRGWLNENTATLLVDGIVLFVGNAENDGSPGEAEVYDPVSGTFAFSGNTHAPHEFSAAVRLLDGTVLIAGGQLPGGSGSTGADLYLPATGTFVSAGDMILGLHEHTATLLQDGTVLIAGGFSTWPIPTSSAEIYRPSVAHRER